MSEEEDGNLEKVFGGESLPAHSKLPERRIKPWHKPRKQWIRRNQWLKRTAELCDQLNLKEGRPLRYLSLPGEDLLDVRVIRECCSKLGIKLKYLGLNDVNSSDDINTWLHIAWNEVNSLDSIHQDSLVIRDRFEQIGNPRSKAFRYVQEYGPFDVINLDLCESISPMNARSPNYYTALEALACEQVKTRAANEPWLLLITSKVGGPWVHDSDMIKLAECITANAKAHPEFRSGLDSLVPNGVAISENSSTKWKKIDQEPFLNLFGIGLGKWLLQLLSNASPKWGVKLLCGYSYRVHAPVPDMISLAFMLEGYAEEPRDRVGLSNSRRQYSSAYDEKRFALELLNMIRKVSDVDGTLGKDKKMYKAMEQETLDLLISARYRPESVREGLKKFAV